jgi:hypothetical protein
MERRITIGLAALAVICVIGAALFYSAYYNSFYAIDRANALFSRAETAGFAGDMIDYIQRGRVLLPRSGNPVWWFPTDKTNFGEIQKDIDGIIARARLLQAMPTNSSTYQQGMDDLRGKVKALELQVAEASGYMFVSGSNMVVSLIWLAALAIFVSYFKRAGTHANKAVHENPGT